MGGSFTLCIFLKPIKDEPIVKGSYNKLNVSVFQATNQSEDFFIDKLQLHFAIGHVIEEPFASVSGYVLEGSFYGTVYMNDTIHFLEPRNRKSKDLRIMGKGLNTLLHRYAILQIRFGGYNVLSTTTI